jgi:hypothetical protein
MIFGTSIAMAVAEKAGQGFCRAWLERFVQNVE